MTGVAVDERTALSELERSAVRALVGRCAATDGVSPLNEQARLAVQGGRPARHFVAMASALIVAYAQLDPVDGTVQLCVSPAARRRGEGRRLAEAVRAAATGQTPSWWAFGTLPAATALAGSLELILVRQLLTMAVTLPSAHIDTGGCVPAGVTLRGFTEADLDEFVALNAAVFAHHPEQGAVTAADVRMRMAEAWFSADGLLLAVDDHTDALLGYHWTKITRDVTGRSEGEVYVLGVHPNAEGRGLGRALLAAGLDHLARQGVQRVRLYVEAAEDRVVRMYERAGFEVTGRDSLFAAVPPAERFL